MERFSSPFDIFGSSMIKKSCLLTVACGVMVLGGCNDRPTRPSVKEAKERFSPEVQKMLAEAPASAEKPASGKSDTKKPAAQAKAKPKTDSKSKVETKQDDESKKKLAAIPGIDIKSDTKGLVTAVDFKGCGEGWVAQVGLIKGLPQLTTLSLPGPSVTDAVIESLGSLPNVRTLRLEQAAVTDKGMELVAKYPRLEDINLDRCNITDEALKSLATSKSIKRIRLPRSKTSDKGLSYLKDAKGIELLDLSDCPMVTDEGLASLAGLTNVRNLSLWEARFPMREWCISKG